MRIKLMSFCIVLSALSSVVNGQVRPEMEKQKALRHALLALEFEADGKPEIRNEQLRLALVADRVCRRGFGTILRTKENSVHNLAPCLRPKFTGRKVPGVGGSYPI